MDEGSSPSVDVMLTSSKAREIELSIGPLTSIQLEKVNRVKQYNLNPKKCRKCNITLLYEKRYNDFCSQSCAAKFNNLGVCRNPKKHNRTCPICKHQMSIGAKICRKCHKEKYKILYTNLNTRYVKSSVLRKHYENIRGHKCEKCGNTLWNGIEIPLNAHHIDGDAYHNGPDNILLLCPNCHAQTPNFCSKNRGNGKFKIIRVPK